MDIRETCYGKTWRPAPLRNRKGDPNRRWRRRPLETKVKRNAIHIHCQLLTPTEPQIEPQPPSSPAVRFKSTIEEIAPDDASTNPQQQQEAQGVSLGNPGDVSADELRDLSSRLKACPMQEKRMNIFSYDPISLPASRVGFPTHNTHMGVLVRGSFRK